MFKLHTHSLNLLIYLSSLANTFAIPLGNFTNVPYLNVNNSVAFDQGYHFSIPGTTLTLHSTLQRPKSPLPYENTLVCLHKFAQNLSTQPQSAYLDRIRIQTTNNIEATIAPVHCPVCALTYREACKVLAGLWIFTSREELLYEQRYGVFEGDTGRMVAWGTLLMAPVTPRMSESIGTLADRPLGLAQTS